MRKLFLIFGTVLFLIGAATFINAQTPSGSAQSAEQEHLIDLSNQWMEALERQDQAALESFLADDFYISVPGETEKTLRGEWLKNALEMNWHNLRFHNFKVDVYGETAVVSASLDFSVTNKLGIPISSNVQVTDIWVKRNNQWQVTARHLGEYSLADDFRLVVGFIAGLAACLIFLLLLKIKRRFLGKRNINE